MRTRGTYRGSITVFLCLLLAVVFAFVGACLEYARARAVSSRGQMAVDAAAESVFAGYHDPLFTGYQLLGRYVPGRDFSSLEELCVRYGNLCGGSLKGTGDGADLCGFLTEEAQWSQVSWLTDEDGRIFSEMAVRSMTTGGALVLAAEWLTRLGFAASSTEKVLSETARKDTWKLEDLMEGYDSWSEAVRKAEEEAVKKQQEENAEGDSGEGEAADDVPRESEESRKVLNLIETMRTLLSRGSLSLVLPEGAKLSAGTVPGGSLPSDGAGGGGGSFTGGNTLLFHEYLVRHMDCFTSETKKGTAYELEYLLAGKGSDEANLQSVVNRIFWIRMGMNVLFLKSSGTRMAQVQEAAVAAVGWTGQPALIEATKVLLTGLWAAGESLVDVRSLLNRQSLPLVKTEGNWRLAFWDLPLAASGDTLAKRGSDTKDLSYVDYLRICLFLGSESTIRMRALDVIEWNVKKVEPGFRVGQCMVKGKLTLHLVSKPIFNSLYRLGAESSSFRKTGSFSYLS